ncbi:MAG TPA: AraC family transcriptional regulator [Abditibacteriaceae bacterium]|jgi:AraC-like DNA-binding protein
MTELLSIRLFLARNVLIENDWSAQNRRSTFWRLFFNDGPGVVVESQGVVYRIEPQRLFLLPARCGFNLKLQAESRKPTRHFAVHFDVPGLPGFHLRYGLGGPLQLPVSLSLEALAQSQSDAIGSKVLRFAEPIAMEQQLGLQGLVFGALGAAWEALPSERRGQNENFSTLHSAILPAVRYIENHTGEAMSNEQLAGLCHLSKGHFIRRFGEGMGRPPMTYLLERRIALAAQRLLFSNDSIETIATDLGFGNRFYFSRMFAQQVGLSPAAFRRDGNR